MLNTLESCAESCKSCMKNQVFNEVNARKPDSMNVFDGLFTNKLFMYVILFTVTVQVLTHRPHFIKHIIVVLRSSMFKECVVIKILQFRSCDCKSV